MNFLAGDIPSSDSDDDDYVPTEEPRRNQATLSIRKRAPGLTLDHDHEDDSDDLDDSDLDDPVAIAAQAEALRQMAGSPPRSSRRPGCPGPSAAGSSFAPVLSTAPASSSTAGCPPYARPLLPSLGTHVRDPDSDTHHIHPVPPSGHSTGRVSPHDRSRTYEGPPPSAPDPSPQSSQLAPSPVSVPPSASASGAPSSSAQQTSSLPSTAAVAASSGLIDSPADVSLATATAASSVAVPPVGAPSASASVPAFTGVVPANGQTAAALEKPSSVPITHPSVTKSNAQLTGLDDGSGEPPTKKPHIDSADASLQPENSKKPQSLDDIWAEMNASTVSKKSTKPSAVTADPGLMGWLTQPEPKSNATKSFKLKRLGDLEKHAMERKQAEAEAEKAKHVKPLAQTGLEAVLSAVRGPKKDGVLGKTREVWNNVKEEDAELKTELESYKKDKNRYTDKVAFLQRSDMREWEREQDGKRKRR